LGERDRVLAGWPLLALAEKAALINADFEAGKLLKSVPPFWRVKWLKQPS
jgi:hypothetical protein